MYVEKVDLVKVKRIIKILKERNTLFLSKDVIDDYLNTGEQIILNYYLKQSNLQNKVVSTRSNKISWEEYNPYDILGLENFDYTHEELVNALNLKILELQKQEKDIEIQKKLIDEVLDAFNEIDKTKIK